MKIQTVMDKIINQKKYEFEGLNIDQNPNAYIET